MRIIPNMDRAIHTVLETEIELKLPVQQYARLTEAANVQHVSVPLLIQTAIQEWLDRQARILHAYRLMDELADGLGESQPPHDIAANHDAYLYSRDVA